MLRILEDTKRRCPPAFSSVPYPSARVAARRASVCGLVSRERSGWATALNRKSALRRRGPGPLILQTFLQPCPRGRAVACLGPRCAPSAGLLPAVLVTRPITFHPAWEVKHGSRTLLSENAPVAVAAYRRAVAGVDRIAGRFAGHSGSDRPRGVGASLPEISALRTMHREMPYPLVYRS